MADLYRKLGVQTLINAAGTYTFLGGSKMSRETLDAMAEAAGSFVQIRELQQKVNAEIARLTRNEAAYVPNGAAAGLYLSIAAAIQLKHGKSRFYYLGKREIERYNIVLFKAHRNPYDLVVGQLGAEYREVSFPNIISPATAEDLDNAIDDHTAAIYFALANWTAPGDMALEAVLDIAKARGVPVIVDAAAQLPPVENLWRLTGMGATAALFSGGKDLCGPQSSGLMVGKREFMDVVVSLGFPNYGIGRMLKVGREELVGLYSALCQYLARDHAARARWCEDQVALAIASLAGSECFVAERRFPNEAGQPIARVLVRVVCPHLSAAAVKEYLLRGDPGVYVMGDQPDSFYLNPMTLAEGDMKHIVELLRRFEIETKKRLQ